MSEPMVMQKAYYVTADELFLLLYSRKIEQLPLLEGIVENVPQDESAIRATMHMVQGKLMTPDDDNHLVLDESVRNILETVKNYDYAVIEKGLQGDIVPRCLYFAGKDIAEISPDIARDGYYKIRQIDMETLVEEIEGYGIWTAAAGNATIDGTKEGDYDADDVINNGKNLLSMEIYENGKSKALKTGTILLYNGSFLEVISKGASKTVKIVHLDDLGSLYAKE